MNETIKHEEKELEEIERNNENRSKELQALQRELSVVADAGQKKPTRW